MAKFRVEIPYYHIACAPLDFINAINQAIWDDGGEVTSYELPHLDKWVVEGDLGQEVVTSIMQLAMGHFPPRTASRTHYQGLLT